MKLEKLKSGELTAVKNVQNCLRVIKEKNSQLNALLYVAEKEALHQAKIVDAKEKKGLLAGLTVVVKANINVIGMPISCASKTLENYKGTYDADVVKRIKQEDGIILGIANCDEFASGVSGETSAFNPTLNPRAPDYVPGGSSSGSAAAVASGMADLALGSDTGGSIRNPASHCGVVGIKPSYGRVSRHGLCDLSMSLDQIGPLARDVYSAALLLQVISGHSDNDPTTFFEPVRNYSGLVTPRNLRLGISPEFKALCVNDVLYSLFMQTVEALAHDLDAGLHKISLKNIFLGVQTYYPIVYTEFFSSTRRYDGRRFGEKIDQVAGEEASRRLVGGREISRAEHNGAYYRKALQSKQIIKEDFDNAFENVDVILSLVTPDLPHKLGEKLSPEAMYAMDAFTIPASLAGVCAGVVSIGEIDGIPVGMQVIAPAFKEDELLNVMKAIESRVE